MPEQPWEYCLLVEYAPQGMAAVHEPAAVPGTAAEPGDVALRAACRVAYYSSTGTVERELTDRDGRKLFGRAMGLLGAAGWELVAVLPGGEATAAIHRPGLADLHARISRSSKGAFFKRPTQPGRPVDAPKLEL